MILLYSKESGKAGEGVRLKLQTPLFVADALVGATGRLIQVNLTPLAMMRASLCRLGLRLIILLHNLT
jgi:hypothetical protein